MSLVSDIMFDWQSSLLLVVEDCQVEELDAFCSLEGKKKKKKVVYLLFASFCCKSFNLVLEPFCFCSCSKEILQCLYSSVSCCILKYDYKEQQDGITVGTAARVSLIHRLPGAGSRWIEKSIGKLLGSLFLPVTDETGSQPSVSWGRERKMGNEIVKTLLAWYH